MPAEADSLKPAGMVPDEIKFEPKSKGLLTPRKKKPKELAVITECCTGCAGSPACVEYCPVEDCMFWVPDEDHPPFGRIQVDPILCIGCKKCLSKGPDGCFLDGCPWDAIVMVDTVEVEKEVGVMPILAFGFSSWPLDLNPAFLFRLRWVRCSIEVQKESCGTIAALLESREEDPWAAFF